MQKQTLNGLWQLEIPGCAAAGGDPLPVTVPGSVYSALLDNQKIEDPFWRDNELEALELMEHDFIFSRSFDLDMPGCKQLLLVCEGLDTICDLTLNGQALGRADNMHRIWEFDVTSIVRPKDNELRLIFRSPTKEAAQRYEEIYTDGSGDAMRGFSQVRKAHCMYGWDWGPRLPDAGIWRSISIVGVEQERIDSVYITQKHCKETVELSFAVEKSGGGTVKITVTGPCGEVFDSDGSPIVIPSPKLWWPNGHGEQPLYTVRVEVPGDIWERRIGLRTLTVKRKKDEWGESFALTVNGLSIFAMGGDYIPQDNLLSRVTEDKIRILLEDCAAAHFNCVRVWGGGIYPQDTFFDVCDELGLIVWQDFMFACAVYELTPEFEENIRAEFIDNIKRLRHHPSLGLWCGNNEMEWQYDHNAFKMTPKQRADYTRIFGYILPQVVREHDPGTFFWPSSPSSGGDFDEPNDENRGDVHYWDVWHGNKPFSAYRDFYFRFASEFGFQSFPDSKTVRAFTLEEDRNVFSRVMEMHQRNRGANGKIMIYLAGTYRYPHNFDLLLYASQLLQADAIRYGVEHWRRHRGRCMGAVYWQINDIWPVASWASIDYFGRWKALHYAAKRFFAPVLLSCCETGEMTERPSCVSQPEPIRKAARFSIANETAKIVSGTVRWALRDPLASILKNGEISVTADAFSSVWLDEIDFTDCDELYNYVSFEYESNGAVVSSGTALFCMPKHYPFKDPKLQVVQNGDTITVCASAYAKSVEIYSDDSDFVLSDNFFDLNAGSVTVRILRGEAKDIKARSVYDLQ
ncbi:MAG: glycoside hydrolase family 2 protein [Oscillospiraceae bacterium]|jgi:beta-mannosidase|nr:glycoside hydrolase family 2 protein [Oscillospiraceae bacterium]